MGSLTGKTALITGASRGIGRAIALRLAAEGAAVILHCHRNRASLEELAAGLVVPAVVVQADLASVEQIQKMFRELGNRQLDVLIHNAGIWKTTPMGSTTPQLLDELVAVNFKSVFWTMQLALPLLREDARIVNVSSTAAQAAVIGRSAYGATKAAVEALTRNWALELAPRRILVNAVAPGYIETDMTAKHLSDPETHERALRRHPLGRMGTAEDVADVVAFLCSPDARFVTGQVINVSGGFVL